MDLDHALLHLRKDDKLNSVIEIAIPPQFQASGNVYYELLDSVVSQQLSVKVARVIFNRFCALFPDSYPHPELLVQLQPEQLRHVGLSGQKASYLQNIASFALENRLEEYDWSQKNDEEIIQFLTTIKGVGRWTVQMMLMFTLGRPDVFPTDDLGIQQSIAALYGLDSKGTVLKKHMEIIAEPWKPYRSVASWYLWRWKEMKA
jgi:DNA-3-methyladenine glycosylase II